MSILRWHRGVESSEAYIDQECRGPMSIFEEQNQCGLFLKYLAATSVVRAIVAKLSAVSVKSIDCLSRKDMIDMHLSTLEALPAHLTSASILTKS